MLEEEQLLHALATQLDCEQKLGEDEKVIQPRFMCQCLGTGRGRVTPFLVIKLPLA